MKPAQVRKPRPPPSSTKEEQKVWEGWNLLGDREVAREAATKGNHIGLALTFLSLRRRASLDDTKYWFRKEISIFADELLERKQIYRATHVLTNVGADCTQELIKKFRSTTRSTLRTYIANHLSKTSKMDADLSKLWGFVEILINNPDSVPTELKLPEESIDCLSGRKDEWKWKVATILYLKTFDDKLECFLNGEVLWAHLVETRDTALLKSWIRLAFNGQSYPVPEIHDGLKRVFSEFPISGLMVNDLLSNAPDVPPDFVDDILNELSVFGIFCDRERTDVVGILRRLSRTTNVNNIFHVFSNENSAVSLENFYVLLMSYCLENRRYIELGECLKDYQFDGISDSSSSSFGSDVSRHLNLLIGFRKFGTGSFSVIDLRRAIVDTSVFLSGLESESDDPLKYLRGNPLIGLTLLVLSDVSFVDLVSKKTDFILNDLDLSAIFDDIFDSCRSLKIMYDKYNGNLIVDKVTLYNLLATHQTYSINNIFDFRRSNLELPSFNHPGLVNDAYTFNKTVDYIFYLRQSRPTIACKIFYADQFKRYGKINEDDLTIVLKKVHKLALRNFEITEVAASCVTFMELLGLDSLFLRTDLKAANILYDNGYDKFYIETIFIHPSRNCSEIKKSLEHVFLYEVNVQWLNDQDRSSDHFVHLLRLSETPIKFSNLNNIDLPESFLRLCGSNNLWLPFVLFSQIHQYPPEQIKEIVQSFKSPNLLEHLYHSVVNEMFHGSPGSYARQRDARKSYLSKLGVRREIDTANILNRGNGGADSLYSSMYSESSVGSVGNTEFDIYLNTKATLLQTLIRCHNSSDPPKALLQASLVYKNPLLAVFATSYEPDSKITNWLIWLAVSCDLCEDISGYESLSLSSRSVTNLLETCMKRKYPKALLESFQIFIPENPLKHFLQFLNCLIKIDIDYCDLSEHLKNFSDRLHRLRRQSILNDSSVVLEPDVDYDRTYLTNRLWLEKTALTLLSAALQYNSPSLHDRVYLLKSIVEFDWNEHIELAERPDFVVILKILECLSESDSKVTIDVSKLFVHSEAREEIIACINGLLDEERFEVASKIALAEDLPIDLIVIKEWESRFSKAGTSASTSTSRCDLEEFWKRCDGAFLKHNVTADCVIDFYTKRLDSFENDDLERYRVLKLAHSWAARFDLTVRYELELKVWLAYLRLECKEDDIPAPESKCFVYEKLSRTLRDVPEHEGEVTADARAKIELLLNGALRVGNFWLALKLEKMFKCKNEDLDLLKLCYNLAESKVLPYQLTSEQRLILTGKSKHYNRLSSSRRPFFSSRLSTYSSGSSSNLLSVAPPNPPPQVIDPIDSPIQDTLAVIEGFVNKLTNGCEIGQNICMMYRISVNMEMPYKRVIESKNSIEMLKEALKNDCMNKLEVVHDVITIFNWDKIEIADFLCEAVVETCSNYVKSPIEAFKLWDMEIDKEFARILQLLQDNCSLLGYQLYAYASTSHKSYVASEISPKTPDLALIIELLIRAHDCFTADCNMEGIMLVLKKSHKIVYLLESSNNWRLMVRLLTGVGRYTEMNYVFQLLREKDQFEFLLKKGLSKNSAFKVALLEYLTKYCPENPGLYKMVALHFSLFSEVAQLWEKESESMIRNLIEISRLEMQNNNLNPESEEFVLFTHTDGTVLCLTKTIENYRHATEFHMKGEKLSKAISCARQGELLALQLYKVKSQAKKGCYPCILNLSKAQIMSLLVSDLNFEEAIIVAESYNINPDWSAILYEHYIIQNQDAYLDAFMESLPLSNTLVHGISRLYISAEEHTEKNAQYMKRLLDRIDSVHMKYKVASELGFADFIEKLLEEDQLFYLKDTVWKQGFRN